MDNYKIKVKDEAENKEAQELFFELGYEWKYKNIGKNYHADSSIGFLYADHGCITTGDKEHGYDFFKYRSEGNKRVTLPQLRDLVVLKRNDVKDATHVDQYGDKWLYLDERHYVYLNDQWDLPIGEFLERYELKPILPVKNQDPALFSIDDVWKAFWKNQKVQYSFDDDNHWQDDIESLKIEDIKSGHYQFRLKPQTIKVELELPKPFEPKEDCQVYILDDGKTDGYRRYSYEVHGDKGNTFIGIWRTKEEIKQVVAQLRKIRGTNS